MAVRRDVLLEVGCFDPLFVYGHDETDLFVRLARAGATVMFAEGADVRHKKAEGKDRTGHYTYDWARGGFSTGYFSTKHFGALAGTVSVMVHSIGMTRNILKAWIHGESPARTVPRQMVAAVSGLLRGWRVGMRLRGGGA